MSAPFYAVGIDGGGTKTTACVISSDGKHFVRIVGDATNYNIKEEKKIQHVIAELTAQLGQKTGIEKPRVLGVCLSGLGQPGPRARIRHLVQERELAEEYHVDHDARAALFGAFAGGAGIILIAGTGSIAFAQNAEGELFRCGGWGYLLGDEGSGFDIARKGLTAALKDFDGRGPKTSLRRAFEKELGVARIDEAVPKIYSDYSGRGQLARFAPIVFEHSRRGDAAARGIIADAGRAYAELVLALLPQLKTEGAVPVALLGNIFKAGELLTAQMQAVWAEHGVMVDLVAPLFPAEVGAALLAMQQTGRPMSPEALSKLKEKVHAETE